MTAVAVESVHSICIAFDSKDCYVPNRPTRQKKLASEDITGMQPECDHYFISTRGARFHADHINLCIGVVKITTGESSEIFRSCLVGNRDPPRKGGLNWVLCIMLRNVAEGVTF